MQHDLGEAYHSGLKITRQHEYATGISSGILGLTPCRGGSTRLVYEFLWPNTEDSRVHACITVMYLRPMR